MLELFRQNQLTAAEAAQELGLSKRRIYELRSDYLKAYAQGQQRTWTPGYSGGDHSVAWPENVVQLLRRPEFNNGTPRRKVRYSRQKVTGCYILQKICVRDRFSVCK
jgi:hypothetical protein